MPAINITDLNNAKLDVDHIAAIATSLGPTATDRLGHIKQTMQGATDAITTKVAAVEAAKNNAVANAIPAAIALVDEAVAATYVGQAGAAKDAAVAAKNGSELALSAAQANAGIKDTTAIGITDTTSTANKYFWTPVVGSTDLLILWKNVAGVAVEQGRYPSSAFIASRTPLGLAWSVLDDSGNAAIGITDNGTFRAAKVQFDSQSVGGAAVEDAVTPGYVWTVRDEAGNVALGLREDGKLESTPLEKPGSAAPLVERYGGTYSAQLNFIATQGQSLAGGSDAALTTVQEYDNIGFGAMSTSPGSASALTVANTQTSQGGENPMYGTSGHIKALIAAEHGLSYTLNDYQLLSCCNGNSGETIDRLSKGGATGMYERSISQAASGKAIATSSGRSFAWQAITWTQGESDAAMPKGTYKSKLKQMIADYQIDGKAATGQISPILCIGYQLSGYAARDTIAPAQLELSEESPLFKVATPIYFMDFYDGTHLKGQSSKWLGGYYGLVYKRVLIDGKDWQPLKPVQHAVLGNTLDLYFNKEGLVFDTVGMPAQVNQGITVFDGASAVVAISAVSIVGPNRVRLTFATPPQPGWTVKYGHINVVGKTNYTGGGGNLRDSAGDQLVYAAIGKPMHNWSVLFSRTI
ncbi:hypothetical protein RCH06_001875 [Polaromonas sp. CG_9.5]|uniref:sialate O-acetylesterase n=1 Tax=Polaromonas sp. CG_9.5 TaxID=3071705 RepID=UPI002E0B27DD|nr:hypothetical protein [Polaromonas sp. CG_9.5]